MENHQLILASESPRRKDLLQKAGFFFHVFSVKVSENLEKNLTLDEQIITIARRKAEAALAAFKPSKSQSFLFLAADTLVIHDDVVLGKPSSEKEAAEFLGRLSGSEHLVKTAVVLIEATPLVRGSLSLRQSRVVEGLETTKVIFKHLSEKQIKEYILSGDPMDKAGAYGIQGGGGIFVEKVVGPYDNVVGLPMDLTKKLIKETGIVLATAP